MWPLDEGWLFLWQGFLLMIVPHVHSLPFDSCFAFTNTRYSSFIEACGLLMIEEHPLLP